jgi:phosphocarrier protein HPr
LNSIGSGGSPAYFLVGMTGRKQPGAGQEASREMVVTNQKGIHARPAAMFVKAAQRFHCDIYVEKDGEMVNGKSIMGLMMLAAGPGSRLTVRAEGDDATRAVTELEHLLHSSKFNQELPDA